MKIGFIGLGIMGGSMAYNTLRAGSDLAVHDIRREATTRHLEEGASWADTPRQVAEASDIVFWERGEVVLTRQAIAAEFVGEVVEIEAPPGSDRDEEGRESRGRGRPRRGREGRGRGDSESQDRPPRDRPPRDRGPQPQAESTPKPSPSFTAPVRSNGDAAQPEGAEKKMSYGRRPKFDKGSGRR